MENQERLKVLQGYTKRLVEHVFEDEKERDICYEALDMTHQLHYDELEKYYLNGMNHFIQTIGMGPKEKEKQFFENYYYLATIPIASLLMEEKNLPRLRNENEALRRENQRLKEDYEHLFTKHMVFLTLGAIGLLSAFGYFLQS